MKTLAGKIAIIIGSSHGPVRPTAKGSLAKRVNEIASPGKADKESFVRLRRRAEKRWRLKRMRAFELVAKTIRDFNLPLILS